MQAFGQFWPCVGEAEIAVVVDGGGGQLGAAIPDFDSDNTRVVRWGQRGREGEAGAQGGDVVNS